VAVNWRFIEASGARRCFRSLVVNTHICHSLPLVGTFWQNALLWGSKDEHLRQKVANWDDFSFSRVLRAVYRLFPYRRWLREGHLFRWYTSRLDR